MKRIAVAIGLLLLAGCASAEQLAVQDDATCQSWGAATGTADYAACRTALTQKRSADAELFSQRLSAAGRAMSAASSGIASPDQSPAFSSAPTIRATCFARGERTSGFNKLCAYDCLGSAHVITVNAASLCPLTVQQ